MALRPNPYAVQADAVRAGAKLFRQHCAECHHTNAEGGDDAPSLRAAHVQAAPPGALFWFVTNGDLRRGMPSWSRLPAERRWQLVSYLQSLGPVRP
jgi:mono/diheme cytochrome c family protein